MIPNEKQKTAIRYTAQQLGWDKLTIKELELMVYALFQYYVMRLSEAQPRREDG